MQVFSKLRFFGRKASSSEAPVVASQQEHEAIDYFTLDHTHHDEVVVSGKNPAVVFFFFFLLFPLQTIRFRNARRPSIHGAC